MSDVEECENYDENNLDHADGDADHNQNGFSKSDVFSQRQFLAPMADFVADSRAATPSKDPIETTITRQMEALKCDDCEVDRPSRIWRWCSACERVICEACTLDRHDERDSNNRHIVEPYPSALRRYNDELVVIQKEARSSYQKIRADSDETRSVYKTIESIWHDIKRDVAPIVNESRDSCDTLNSYLECLREVGQAPLNGRNVVQRKQVQEGIEKLREDSTERVKEAHRKMLAIKSAMEDVRSKIVQAKGPIKFECQSFGGGKYDLTT